MGTHVFGSLIHDRGPLRDCRRSGRFASLDDASPWDEAPSRSLTLDERALIEFRLIKNRFTRTEWSQLDAEAKSRLAESARHVVLFSQRASEPEPEPEPLPEPDPEPDALPSESDPEPDPEPEPLSATRRARAHRQRE